MGGLADAIVTQDAKTAMATIKTAESAVGKVAEAGKLRAALSKVRRALRGKNPDPATAQKQLIKALSLFDSEVAWRRAAADGLLDEVRALDAAMAGTIGGETLGDIIFEAKLQAWIFRRRRGFGGQ